MIKAALFDVFGTCVDWRTGVARYAGDMLAAKGLPEGLGLAIADQWRAMYDPAMEEVRAGRRAYVPLDVIQRENLDTVLAALDLADAFDAAERDGLNTAWEHLPAWPDTAAALERLKVHMPIAACSNGSVAMMTALAAYTGLPWPQICGAELAQNYKRHPSVYLKSCAALGYLPSETIMIACHGDDLDAAQSFGLQTGYFPRPLEHGRRSFAADAAPERFTYHGDTLGALVGKIVSSVV